MAPTPLTATHRLTFLYTVNGLQHKQQNYVSAAASIDPAGYDLAGRPALGNVGLSTVVDPFFTVLAPYYKAANVTFDGAQLFLNSAGAFVFLTSVITTVAPAATATPAVAMQICVSGKDENNRELPAYLYEPTVGAPTKISSYGALGAPDQAIANYFFNAGGTATAVMAWNWRLSRGQELPKRWLAWVVDSNEKLRRIRHIK